MKLRWRDLIEDPATGRLSESKLWIHPVKAAMLWAFCWETYHGRLTESILWAFGILLLSHETVSRIVSWRFGQSSTSATVGADGQTPPK